MRKVLIKLMIYLSLGVLLIGCSGGGSSEIPATGDNGQVYDLQDFWTKNNYSMYADATFSDTSDTYTYSISTTKQDDSILNGIYVTNILTIGAFTNTTTGGANNINRNVYYNSNGIKIESLDNDDGTICTLDNNPIAFSSETKVGDSGIGSYMVCTDGTRDTETWRLIQIDNDVVMEEVSSFYDTNDEIFGTSTSRYTIDITGEIKKYSNITYYANSGVTLTIHPSVVNQR